MQAAAWYAPGPVSPFAYHFARLLSVIYFVPKGDILFCPGMPTRRTLRKSIAQELEKVYQIFCEQILWMIFGRNIQKTGHRKMSGVIV